MSTAIDTPVFVHPQGLCESRHVGEGTRIWAFSHVMDGAVIGSDCNLCDGVFVESGARVGNRVTLKNGVFVWDGVTIEDDVFVGPGVVFTNDRYPRSRRMPEAGPRYDRRENWLLPTRICRGASLGAGAVIVCGVVIGRHATVGAGSVVTRVVPDHRLVLGNPARPVGWVCACGMRLDDDLMCVQCRRRFQLNEDALIEAD
jgi:acetyltransferase-like isoleucine patch superfamily enzyme